MNPGINIKNQLFRLLPQKALFWEEQKAVLLSDVHLGKATHFRKNGLAMPAEAGKKDLDNLRELFAYDGVEKVFILGDLFHSTLNHEWDWFLELLNEFPHLSFFLIRGNHDIIPAFKMKHPNLKVMHKYVEDGICLIHEPLGNESAYVISGHIHPGVQLKGKGRQRLNLPCFVVGSNRLILPAFGALTGLALLTPTEDDQIFVVAENRVIGL